MRLHCWACGKSVSTEVPDDTVLRAITICPECIERGEVRFPDDDDQERARNDGTTADPTET